jgi:hypothetical protein
MSSFSIRITTFSGGYRFKYGRQLLLLVVANYNIIQQRPVRKTFALLNSLKRTNSTKNAYYKFILNNFNKTAGRGRCKTITLFQVKMFSQRRSDDITTHDRSTDTRTAATRLLREGHHQPACTSTTTSGTTSTWDF